MSLVEVENLSVEFGAKRVVRDVSFHLDRGETLALVGESGSGKSLTALSLAAAAAAWREQPHGTHRARRRIHDRRLPERAPSGPRRSRRHRLPGADDQPEPAAPDRPAGRRGDHVAPSIVPRRGARAGADAARAGRLPRLRASARGLPAPALGRATPAGDDRDGARQRPRVADRRRADHRARRHHPGADPGAARSPEGGARAGAAADHARPGDRSPPRRAGLRHAGRRDRGERSGGGRVRRTPASLHARLAGRRARRPPGPDRHRRRRRCSMRAMSR